MSTTTKVEIKILSSSDPSNDKHTVLYMGKPKSGKTHNICSWPKPLIISFDPNLATMRKFPGVDYIVLERGKEWSRFEWYVLPRIINREYPYETIAIDSWSTAGDCLIAELKKQGLSGFDLWADVFNKLMGAVNDMVGAAKVDPLRPELPTYHILGSTHESPETDDKGHITEVLPAIGGASRTKIAGKFNTVLLTRSEVKTLVGTGPTTYTPNYFCWAVPPNTKYQCGDGYGGGPERKTLPAKVAGTYEGLNKAWGTKTLSETDSNPASKA